MRNENFKLAIKEFDGLPEHTSVREIDEMRGLVLFFRASCHLELEELAEAKRDVIESVGCGEDSPAFFLHGEFLMQEQRYEDARNAYQIALKQDKTNVTALLGIGWSTIHLRKYELARQSFFDAYKLDPVSEDARFGYFFAVGCKHQIKHHQLFFPLDIPQNKADNAINSYAGCFSPKRPGEVIILYDATIWGSAKDGMTIGCNALAFKNALERPNQIRFSEIYSVRHETSPAGLRINGTYFIRVTSHEAGQTLAKILQELLFLSMSGSAAQ